MGFRLPLPPAVPNPSPTAKVEEWAGARTMHGVANPNPAAMAGGWAGALTVCGKVCSLPQWTRGTRYCANIFTAAMSAGAFDDEDAHGVKGLNDLGGGRLYDNTGGGGLSQRERVTGKTMKILEHRDKRFVKSLPPLLSANADVSSVKICLPVFSAAYPQQKDPDQRAQRRPSLGHGEHRTPATELGRFHAAGQPRCIHL